MKTCQKIQLRAFDVRVKDERTGEVTEDVIVLSKQQLQAASLIGESSKELIFRIYNRAGFFVEEIGRATKKEITLDLAGLFRETE